MKTISTFFQQKNWLKQIDWINTTFLLLTPVLAVSALIIHTWLEGFQPLLLVVFFIFYIVAGISITAGYHRLFAHRAYTTNNFVKFMYLFFGAGAFQNSALKWATDHRRHHRCVDKEEDPYSIQKGFFFAHMGWIFLKEKQQYKDIFAHDLKKDKLIAWQHKYYMPIAITSGVLLPIGIGALMGSALGGLVYGFLVRVVVVHHATFFINSLCHVVGQQPYTDENSARDSAIMALFTYGEGFHNFHHQFQADYRNGLKWYHWDPTKWTIQLLALFGMAQQLKKTSETEILKSRLAMEEKFLKAKVRGRDIHQQNLEKLEILKERLLVAQARLKELKEEYAQLKRQYSEKSHQKLNEVRAEIARTKREFKLAYEQWKLQIQEMSAAPATI